MFESFIKDPLRKVILIGFIVQFLDDFFPPTMAQFLCSGTLYLVFHLKF